MNCIHCGLPFDGNFHPVELCRKTLCAQRDEALAKVKSLRDELGTEHGTWLTNDEILRTLFAELHALDAEYVSFANGSHGHLRVKRMLAALEGWES